MAKLFLRFGKAIYLVLMVGIGLDNGAPNPGNAPLPPPPGRKPGGIPDAPSGIFNIWNEPKYKVGLSPADITDCQSGAGIPSGRPFGTCETPLIESSWEYTADRDASYNIKIRSNQNWNKSLRKLLLLQQKYRKAIRTLSEHNEKYSK